VAAVSTAILLLIGYPIAYGMARLRARWQNVAMMLVIVPFWTSFLIRIYAWVNILQHDCLLNQILLALHLVSTPVVWFATDGAMYLGIVYSYLPFMILPLYATLSKMDPALLEAANDLGASPRAAFWRVTFPLSLPGIGAGALLCFIPIVGEFVIPHLLAGPMWWMTARALWLKFLPTRTGRWRRPPRSCFCFCCLRPCCCTTACNGGNWSGRDGKRCEKIVAFQHRRARARVCLPLFADRDSHHLFVQRLAAGHGVGWLVVAV